MRASEDMPCECTVFNFARVTIKPGNISVGTNQGKGLPNEFFKLIFPELEQPVNISDKKPGHSKRCDKCGSLIGKGRSHKCSKSVTRANTLGIIRTMSLKSKERTTRDALVDIFEDKGVKRSPRSGARTTLYTGGRKVNIQYGSSPAKGAVKKRKFTRESLQKLQLTLNLSDRQLK